ncbi:MAG: S9 family peptidase [Thermoprotei archaeon]
MFEDYDVLRYYSYREAHTPVIGEDGTLYFVSDVSGKPEIWYIKRNYPFPVQLTFLGGYVSSAKRLGKEVIFQFDPNGSEEHRLLAVRSTGEIRVLTDVSARGVIYRLGGTASRGFSYASNKRSAPFFDSYVNLDGREELVFEYDGTTQPQGLSEDGRWLIVSVSLTNLNNDVYVVDLVSKSSKKIFEHSDEALTVEPTWGPDGLVYACTNMGDEFMQPVVVDPLTGRVSWLSRDRWDAEHIAVSDRGFVAYTRNRDGYSQLHLMDSTRREIFSKEFEGTISELVFAEDTLYFTYSGWDTNTNIHALDLSTLGVRSVTNTSRGHLGEVVRPSLEHYESFDGLRVPMFVYAPSKQDGKSPHPVIVYVHGGPESQKRLDYDGQIQFFLSQGYGVVTPNVRGSTGYGKSYTHLDDVRLRLNSVRDLAWLVKWIEADPRFDETRVCVMGRSYGGYMVLAALAFYPELWRCGVEAVGIASLETFLRNTSVWRRRLREAEYGSLERDLDFLREASPLTHAHRIRAPLLVQHGSNDPRVPLSESKAIVETIRRNGGVAELVVFEDEGHMVQSVQNRLKWAVTLRDFLKKHL